MKARIDDVFKPYFAVLDGYAFATQEDRENALWALFWAGQLRDLWATLDVAYRPPLVVIEGPPGSGKTRLAKSLCAAADCQPRFGDRMAFAHFSAAARDEREVLIYDDMSSESVDEPLLCQWLTASSWETRTVHQKDVLKHELRCMTVVTGCRLDLSEDLMKRSVFIRLVSGDKFGPVVDVRGVMEERVIEASLTLEMKKRRTARRALVRKGKGGNVA